MFAAALGLSILNPIAADGDSSVSPDSVASASRPDSSSAPDSARIALIQIAFQTFDNVQVASEGAQAFGHRATVSSEGVSLRQRQRSVTSVWPSPEERLLQWSEIDSMRVRRGGSAVGPFLGVVAGFSVGAAIIIGEASFSPLGGEQPSPAPMLVGMFVGGMVGFALDHAGPWHRVYP
jgi:hypothetical protein